MYVLNEMAIKQVHSEAMLLSLFHFNLLMLQLLPFRFAYQLEQESRLRYENWTRDPHQSRHGLAQSCKEFF